MLEEKDNKTVMTLSSALEEGISGEKKELLSQVEVRPSLYVGIA